MKPFLGKLSISDLPYPIMSYIISLLPIKSILSCKLVSKLWCSIIRHPRFIRSSKSITLIVRHCGLDMENKNLHLVEPQVDYDVGEINEHLCLMLGKEAVVKFNDVWFNGVSVNLFQFVNTCKGLVCLKSDTSPWGGLVVCNPVMSDYVAVEHLISAEMARSCRNKHAGFGFSSKTNQYKLIRFVEYLERRDDYGYDLEADVCTLGGDEEWRRLENRPPQGFSWCLRGGFLEGALHWLIVHRHTFFGSIVAFDFQDEIFILMDLPIGYGPGHLGKRMELAILRSRLCFCLPNLEKIEQLDFWVMNEYGVKESWNKLFVISAGVSDSIDRLTPFKPLGYWNNGEILMLSVGNELVSYDVTSNEWRAIKIPGVPEMVEAMLLDPIFRPTKNLIMQGNPNTNMTQYD